LATVGHDGNLKIWDSSTGGLLAKVRVVQRGSVEHLVWVGQDRLAVAGGKALRIVGQDGTVHHSVDLKTAVLGLALSTDENPRLAVATYGSMWLLNPATGEQDAQEWQGTLIQPVWSPTGRHLAVGTQERSVQIWQSHPPDRFQMTGYESKIRNISWDGTGRYMATDGAADCAVWDFSGKGPRGTMPIVHSAHQRLISAVAFRPRGIRFATGGLDGLLAIWDLRRPIPGAALIRNSPVSRLVWSPDGDFLYAGFEDGLVLSFANPKESFS
jgi:WD40 repeat protein